MTPQEVLDAAVPDLDPELGETMMKVHAAKCAFAKRHRFQVTYTTFLVSVADAKTQLEWNERIA